MMTTPGRILMAPCPKETTKAHIATRRLTLDKALAKCRCDMVHDGVETVDDGARSMGLEGGFPSSIAMDWLLLWVPEL